MPPRGNRQEIITVTHYAAITVTPRRPSTGVRWPHPRIRAILHQWTSNRGFVRPLPVPGCRLGFDRRDETRRSWIFCL